MTLTGLRRSVTLSNSSNSVVGRFTPPNLHVTPHNLVSCSYFSNPFFIPVNLQPLSKAWKCETPTLRPSLTSSPPTHTSWSSCQIPLFVSVKGQSFCSFSKMAKHNKKKPLCLCFPASAATLINIRNARKHFEKLERVDGPKHSLHMRMR